MGASQVIALLESYHDKERLDHKIRRSPCPKLMKEELKMIASHLLTIYLTITSDAYQKTQLCGHVNSSSSCCK
jgi:hypothetical protein